MLLYKERVGFYYLTHVGSQKYKDLVENPFCGVQWLFVSEGMKQVSLRRLGVSADTCGPAGLRFGHSHCLHDASSA